MVAVLLHAVCQSLSVLCQSASAGCVCKRTGATTLANKTVNSMLPVSGGLLSPHFFLKHAGATLHW